MVVPMAAACSRCHVFTRAWDRFELPFPFTRVVVVLGAPLTPAHATPEKLASAIDRARARALTLARRSDAAAAVRVAYPASARDDPAR
jgi:lysophospholipid acyltransferase (LPLAT)-like uncharacterized protein